jgi:hypothetical protein
MSGHGHVTPNPDGAKARCGGPGLCGACARELAVKEGKTIDRKQTCPRRMNECGPWKRDEGLDEWRDDRGLAGQNRIGLSCSFCGSLHPDRFMELLREGWVLVPTDKRYKSYLSRPLAVEEIAARKARWLADDGIARAVRELGERDGKTPEQIDADLEREWTERQLPGLSSSQEAKFYYQHLSEAQQQEFIDLHNEHRITIGYPGYLYVLPFFCREPAGESQ